MTPDEATAAVGSRVGWKQLPPPPDCCPLCARRHGAEWPHDAQSLHYQMGFQLAHGRWPTWADAIAHCGFQMRTHWETALRARGGWTEPPPGVAPISEPGGAP